MSMLPRSATISWPKATMWVAGALLTLWLLVLATNTGAGPALQEPGEFIVTLLNGLTLAGLLFVVASGFTLIFGLMRTVNMAHGSLFLLSAYIGIEMQQEMVGKDRNINPDEVNLAAWIAPVLVGGLVAAFAGFLMYFLFLRWNRGQELRQALITLAISFIIADQLIARFGTVPERVVWPGEVTRFFEILGERYAVSRLFMLGVAILLGGALWLWLNKTSIGLIIRAGVDDEAMVRALGINTERAFAAVFLVGAFLAGVGGVMGASFATAAEGADGTWLLNSLVVVIIGGLGSLKGAAAGSVLYGCALAFSPAYLPQGYTFYSVIVTFVVLAAVLVARPTGFYGRAS